MLFTVGAVFAIRRRFLKNAKRGWDPSCLTVSPSHFRYLGYSLSNSRFSIQHTADGTLRMTSGFSNDKPLVRNDNKHARLRILGWDWYSTHWLKHFSTKDFAGVTTYHSRQSIVSQRSDELVYLSHFHAVFKSESLQRSY